MWGLANIEELTRDLKFALRRLVKQRAFSLSVVGVMAIGIGGVTTMFSIVDAALLRPLPFKASEQLMVLPALDVPFDAGFNPSNGPARQIDITDARTMKNLFTEVAAFGSGGANLVDAEQPQRLNVGVVTTNFFSVLGINPIRGRSFVDAEGVENGPNVAILSYGLWQQQYGGRDVVGIHIPLGTRSYEVVGVMPQGFSFPSESDVWVPLSIPSTFATAELFKGFTNTLTLARLRPGVTRETANAQLLARLERWQNGIDARSRTMFERVISNARSNGAVRPLQDTLVGDRKTAFYVLLGATGLLLLIACVNVTNLLLSHASARTRELAVRQVLGATRARIVRQLLTESVVLSLAGAGLGLLLAPIALRVMRTLIPASLAGVAPAELNIRVLMFALATALLTGVAFGLWPAFRSARVDQGQVIKAGGGHGATSASSGRVRRVLVSAELALTVMLLIGAGLMLRSFSVLMQRESGLQSAHVATLEMSLASSSGNRGERLRKLNETISRLSAMPGIQSAAAVNDLPLAGQGGISVMINVDGAPPLASGESRGARYLFATSDYFATMGIKLLRGHLFSATEDSLSPRTAVVSKSMADAYWPNSDALGRTFQLGRSVMTVIGVVADVREAKLEGDAGPQMYMNLLVGSPQRLALVARGNVPEQTLLSHMTAAVRSVDKSQAVYNLRMMDDVVSTSVAPRRTNTVLIGAFAILALILASVGVYAVVSYGVSHRSRELGIRSALGATGSSLVTMLAGEMVWVTAIGIAVGLAGAWALAKTLESLVYGVQVHDLLTFVVVPLALLLPTLLATLVPARRVLKVNPAEVMRAD
ncbi:MAG: ABC transporter permease [Gemmatimonas sp.]